VFFFVFFVQISLTFSMTSESMSQKKTFLQIGKINKRRSCSFRCGWCLHSFPWNAVTE